MPIEFRCPQCNRLLRTGDDTAGFQAKCPECGSTMTIPNQSAPPPPLPGSGTPFSTTPPTSGPAGDPANPYQSPGDFGPAQPAGSYYADASAYAAQRVAGPAIALMVTAGISILLALVGMVGAIVMLAAGQGGRGMQGPFPWAMDPAVSLGQSLFGLGMAVLILFGAMKMKALQNYSLSMAVSIIAMIPCISPCCLLGLPFGIWALVVLTDQTVKAAFRG